VKLGREAVIAGVAVVALWAGFAYDQSRPVDAKAYRRTMLQVAAAAHDSAQTGRLIGEQRLDGHVTGPFATTAFDDAAKGVAGAQKKFAAQPPPDDASAALRDRLAPLLSGTVLALGDTAGAADDAALRDGTSRLDELAGKLDDFVTAYGS
jgi:hypothetical protein